MKLRAVGKEEKQEENREIYRKKKIKGGEKKPLSNVATMLSDYRRKSRTVPMYNGMVTVYL